MGKVEIIWFVALIACFIVVKLIRLGNIRRARRKYVGEYVFLSEILARVSEKYPVLEAKDLDLVAAGLRQYFLVYLRANGKMLGMPSKVVDTLWHEFILDTRRYTDFCQQAFGSYFHHIPVSKSHKGEAIVRSMKRTLALACLEEGLNPLEPTRLPLLFVIDEQLNIPGGNVYRLPAAAGSNAASCGGIACGGAAGLDASGCSGDGGCGGGCGGGGD